MGAQAGRSPWVECLRVAGGTHLGHNPEYSACVTGGHVCVYVSGGHLCVHVWWGVHVCVARGVGDTWDTILRAVGFPKTLSRAARPLR